MDYSELKRLAEAATAGPWVHGGTWVSAAKGSSVADCQRGDEKFIAAANPAAVLALIAEIDGLREEVEIDNKIIAERDRLLNAIPECAAHGQCVPHAIQWVRDVQVENSQLLEERDQLKAEVEPLTSQVKALQSDANSYQSGYDAGRAAAKAHADSWRAEAEALRKDAKPLDPVTGNQLPAIGSEVLIHLGRSDAWVEHTVVGYYAWGDLDGNQSLHRVFVRVRDADGYLNARLLKDVRTQVAMGKESSHD